MRRLALRLHLAVLALSVVGCQTKTAPATAEPKTTPAPSVIVESTSPETTLIVEKIGKSYELLARADGLYWAPWDCRAPPPAPAFRSATTEGEHARKIYRLWLQDSDRYASATESKMPALVDDWGTGRGRRPSYAATDAGGSDQPWTVFGETEEVVVKESFVPNPCPDGQLVAGEHVCLKERGPLFVMARPKTPHGATDDGWVYGTIVDGHVTASGIVASCIGCHAKAPHGRLFGLPRD